MPEKWIQDLTTLPQRLIVASPFLAPDAVGQFVRRQPSSRVQEEVVLEPGVLDSLDKASVELVT